MYDITVTPLIAVCSWQDDNEDDDHDDDDHHHPDEHHHHHDQDHHHMEHHQHDHDDDDAEGEQPTSASAIITADIISDPDSQVAQIVAVVLDDDTDEEAISSNDISNDESSDAESAMLVMEAPMTLVDTPAASIWGGVKHACAGMKQAAGSALQQLWSIVLQGTSGPWAVQQGFEQQQQGSVAYGGRAGMMERMMGVEGDDEARVAVQ